MFRADDPLGIQAQPMVVISHSLWQRNYGGDPGLIGTTVQITGRDRVVIGIAPPGFYGLNRMVPIGLLSIAAYLEANGHEVLVHDCLGPAAPRGVDANVARVLRLEPELLGFSATTSGFS